MEDKKIENNTNVGRKRQNSIVYEEIVQDSMESFNVSHQNLRSFESKDRVAFSIMNLTGERLRCHQNVGDKSNIINYLEHLEANELTFPATRSVVKNLQMVEIPFQSIDSIKSQPLFSSYHDSSHLVNVQVLGFSWV